MALIDTCIEDLKRHEGFVPHAYQDSLGFWTIGYGTLIDKRKGGGIPEDVALTLLRQEVLKVTGKCQSLVFWDSLSENRKRVLVNMAYNLGYGGLLNFKKMLSAINSKDWGLAAAEMMNSAWATQVGSRAVGLAEMMKSG